MLETKSIEELASMKAGLAMIYAVCAANALLYLINFTLKQTYPTDAEKLKKLYGKEGNVVDVVKLTGLHKIEVTSNKTLNDIDFLDNK
ncbi:hypothetical protein ANTQUA_LOCUS7582 [Anthophora quadrimaculata]